VIGLNGTLPEPVFVGIELERNRTVRRNERSVQKQRPRPLLSVVFPLQSESDDHVPIRNWPAGSWPGFDSCVCRRIES
jgi:hypothetical protein